MKSGKQTTSESARGEQGGKRERYERGRKRCERGSDARDSAQCERERGQTDRQTETLFDEGLMSMSLWHENAQYINIRTVLLHQRIHHRADTHTLSFLFQLYFQCRAGAANTCGIRTRATWLLGGSDTGWQSRQHFYWPTSMFAYTRLFKI